tara:strand:+ start:1554 stop:2291 length:738 start_codon:yes stop_codon:yes gene_type:complete
MKRLKFEGLKKTVLERKSHPTFDFIVEIKDRYSVSIYKDVAKVVDLYLRGEEYLPEVRQYDSDQGEIIKEDESIHWSDQYDQDMHFSVDSVTSIFPFAINKEHLNASIRDLEVAAAVCTSISEADLLLTTASQVKSNQKVKRLLEGRQIPIHVIKKNSQADMQGFLRDYFQLDVSDDAIHNDIIKEINYVCDRVISEQRVFDAASRSQYQRRIQHRVVSERQLTSLSIGEEPNRRVRVYPSLTST